jgi:hypothetical protein
MDQLNWPTQNEIIQTNIKISELLDKVNSTDSEADFSVWEQLCNEAFEINPNHASGTYADSLMNIKYMLYQKATHLNQDQNNINY